MTEKKKTKAIQTTYDRFLAEMTPERRQQFDEEYRGCFKQRRPRALKKHAAFRFIRFYSYKQHSLSGLLAAAAAAAAGACPLCHQRSCL